VVVRSPPALVLFFPIVMIYSTEHFSVQNYVLKEAFELSRKLARYRHEVFGTKPTIVVSGRYIVDLKQIIYYVWGLILCTVW
jgi:hypothetical protein